MINRNRCLSCGQLVYMKLDVYIDITKFKNWINENHYRKIKIDPNRIKTI